jgi:hypothetical protein
VGGTPYTFKIIGWGQETAPQGIYLQVNGQATSPAEWREGSTYTIPGSTTKVYVNDVSIMSLGAQEKTVSVQLFVGTDKLTLQDGQAVTKNDESTNSMAYFDSSVAPKINALTVEIYPQEDAIVAEDVAFTDPIFEAAKMVLDGMTPGETSDARDLVKMTSSSTTAKLTFTNKDGNTYSEIPVMYANSTGYYRMKDATYNVRSSECNASKNYNVIKKGDYFVVTAGDNSYVLKYDNYYVTTDSTKNYVTLTDLSTSTQYKVYLETSDKYLRIGSLSFLVEWDSGGSTNKRICVDLDGSGSFAESSVNVKTASGQVVSIPQGGPRHVNVTETPLYSVAGSNDPSGTQINLTAAWAASGGVTYTVVPATTQVGTEYEYKTITNYGTYIYTTGDSTGQKTVNLYVPGQRPGYANIAVGSDPVISSSAVGGGTVQEAVQIRNSVSKMESEVSTTALDRDLVLIGGPCANSLVAELLNMSASSPQCVADFTAMYPTEGVITVVEDAFGSGKQALVVAGVDRDATRALAVKVMQDDLDYSA